MFIAGPLADAEAADLRAVRTAPGLESGTREFRVVYGAVPADRTEIALMTRSVLEIMIELSARMDVPPEDATAKRTAPARGLVVVNGAELAPLVRIRWADEARPPAPSRRCAIVAVGPTSTTAISRPGGRSRS